MKGWAVLLLGILLGTQLVAAGALAHGPTLKLAYGRLVPPEITLRVGDTLHFTNANPTGAPCTVVSDDGSFTTPTIPRGPEGYHHTFEAPAELPFHLKEYPSTKGLIRIVD